jgi:hypothetical protein
LRLRAATVVWPVFASCSKPATVLCSYVAEICATHRDLINFWQGGILTEKKALVSGQREWDRGYGKIFIFCIIHASFCLLTSPKPPISLQNPNVLTLVHLNNLPVDYSTRIQRCIVLHDSRIAHANSNPFVHVNRLYQSIGFFFF